MIRVDVTGDSHPKTLTLVTSEDGLNILKGAIEDWDDTEWEFYIELDACEVSDDNLYRINIHHDVAGEVEDLLYEVGHYDAGDTISDVRQDYWNMVYNNDPDED